AAAAQRSKSAPTSPRTRKRIGGTLPVVAAAAAAVAAPATSTRTSGVTCSAASTFAGFVDSVAAPRVGSRANGDVMLVTMLKSMLHEYVQRRHSSHEVVGPGATTALLNTPDAGGASPMPRRRYSEDPQHWMGNVFLYLEPCPDLRRLFLCGCLF
ncbi:unnamed protein product, partial [Ixodes pacificus]